MQKRKPTQDERQGMNWWNNATRSERRYWLDIAKSARPADAWQAFKKSNEYRESR